MMKTKTKHTHTHKKKHNLVCFSRHENRKSWYTWNCVWPYLWQRPLLYKPTGKKQNKLTKRYNLQWECFDGWMYFNFYFWLHGSACWDSLHTFLNQQTRELISAQKLSYIQNNEVLKSCRTFRTPKTQVADSNFQKARKPHQRYIPNREIL